MDAVAVDAVDFIKLAYLIEVAIVLNLAYRELRFNKFYDNLKDKVARKVTEYESSELDQKFTPYLQLKSLFDTGTQKELRCSNKVNDIWVDQRFCGFFYNVFIRTKFAQKITDLGIFISVVSVLLITSFYIPNSDWNYKPEDKLLQEKVWMYLFCVLSFSCLIPIFFMVITTKCKVILFGSLIKNRAGCVPELSTRIDEEIGIKATKEAEQQDKEAFHLGDL